MSNDKHSASRTRAVAPPVHQMISDPAVAAAFEARARATRRRYDDLSCNDLIAMHQALHAAAESIMAVHTRSEARMSPAGEKMVDEIAAELDRQVNRVTERLRDAIPLDVPARYWRKMCLLRHVERFEDKELESELIGQFLAERTIEVAA